MRRMFRRAGGFNRLSLRWQLLLPFGVLAVLWASSGTYLLTRTAMTRAESRIDAELYEDAVHAGVTFTDLTAVQIELQRLAAHTEGVAEAARRNDGGALVAMLQPLLVNSRADALIVLRADGGEQVSLWRTGAEVAAAPASLPPDAVAALLAETATGEKAVVVAPSAQGTLVLAAGPVRGDPSAGIAAAGIRIDTLVSHLARETESVAVYSATGTPLAASTPGLPVLAPEALSTPELIRASPEGREALIGSLSGRGKVVLRVAVFRDASSILNEVRGTASRLAGIGFLSTLGVIAIGVLLARAITRRLARVAGTAFSIAQGDLKQRAVVSGADEVATLAATFNAMAQRLEERSAQLAARSAELEARERHFRSLVQNSSDVITVIDTAGRIRSQSISVQAILGYEPTQLIGVDLDDITHPEDLAVLSSALLQVTVLSGPGVRVDIRLRHRDGSWRWTETVITNLLDEPSVAGLVLNTRDVTERAELAQQLRHQAFHDPLTGLANRALFADRIEHAMTRRDAVGGTTSVLLIDLDDFKAINDSYGHTAGDELLVQVAERLRGALRGADTIARLGGDEFAVLLEDLPDAHVAIEAANRILQVLPKPFDLGARETVIHASIGIVRVTAGVTAQDAMQCADLALYAAKNGGRARFEVYEPRMQAGAIERFELVAELRRAVELNELKLHYQPIVDLASGRAVGLEALVRWWHPQRGEIPPAQFIPLAEETGVIHSLSRWVFDAAFRQFGAWLHAYPAAQGLRLNVNVSTRQLQDPELVPWISEALSRSGVDASRVTLEITESAVMQDAEVGLAKLRTLRDLGMQVALDDFGTGYSSLSYLERLPVDVLKIDKAFIDGEGSAEMSSLLPAIIELGRSLSLHVVAEGIETEGQRVDLAALGCRYGQGFLFGRPMPADEIEVQLGPRAVEADIAEDVPQQRVRIRATI